MLQEPYFLQINATTFQVMELLVGAGFTLQFPRDRSLIPTTLNAVQKKIKDDSLFIDASPSLSRKSDVNTYNR